MKFKKIAALTLSFMLASGIFFCSSENSLIFSSSSVSAVVDEDFVPTISVTEQPKEEYTQFDITDATAAPGNVTYLDIVIGENTGYTCILLFFNYDSSIMHIESLSATHDFVDNYDFTTREDNNALILMENNGNNCYSTNKEVIRVAVKINEDAPAGSYPLEINAKESQACIGTLEGDGKVFHDTHVKATSGTITVSNDIEPETNVQSMSLGRVYAYMEDHEDEIIRKTGDTTYDGKIETDDAAKLSNYFVGKETEIENADVNEDGKVNAADYVLMKEYFVEPDKD